MMAVYVELLRELREGGEEPCKAGIAQGMNI